MESAWVEFFKLIYYAVVIIFGLVTTAALVIIYKKANISRNKWIAFFIISFIFISWPVGIGRLLFEMRCSTVAGLSLSETIDLSASGYYLLPHDKSGKNKLRQSSLPPTHDYMDQATKDIIDGRIKFFEMSLKYNIPSNPDHITYFRFYLADEGSEDCEKGLVPWRYLRTSAKIFPSHKCLAYRPVRTSESKYVIRGYYKNASNKYAGQTKYVEIVNWESGRQLAKYQIITLSPTSLFRDVCPMETNASNSPIHNITQYVFKDKNGMVTMLN